jgi:hypothetical protein
MNAGSIQRMWDELAIRRLPMEYADSVLARDITRLRSLWARNTGDAEPPRLDYRWPDRFTSRQQDFGVVMLHVTTHSITFIDAENALGRVMCIVQMSNRGAFVDQSVVYQDRYRKVDGEWLFAERDHRLWFGAIRENDPTTQEPAHWPKSQVGDGDLEEFLRGIWTPGRTVPRHPRPPS